MIRLRFRNTRPAAVRNRRITSDSDRPWTPVTKLGRLVKDRKVTSIEEIYLRSLPIQVIFALTFFIPFFIYFIEKFNFLKKILTF